MLVSIQKKDKRQIEQRPSQLLRNLSSCSSGLNGIRTNDLCDAGVLLYQLSYQANIGHIVDIL